MYKHTSIYINDDKLAIEYKDYLYCNQDELIINNIFRNVDKYYDIENKHYKNLSFYQKIEDEIYDNFENAKKKSLEIIKETLDNNGFTYDVDSLMSNYDNGGDAYYNLFNILGYEFEINFTEITIKENKNLKNLNEVPKMLYAMAIAHARHSDTSYDEDRLSRGYMSTEEYNYCRTLYNRKIQNKCKFILEKNINSTKNIMNNIIYNTNIDLMYFLNGWKIRSIKEIPQRKPYYDYDDEDYYDDNEDYWFEE